VTVRSTVDITCVSAATPLTVNANNTRLLQQLLSRFNYLRGSNRNDLITALSVHYLFRRRPFGAATTFTGVAPGRIT
jgi:hypothetical protein